MAIAQDRGKICHGTLTTLSIGGTDLGPTSEDGVTFVANQTHFDQKIDQQVGDGAHAVVAAMGVGPGAGDGDDRAGIDHAVGVEAGGADLHAGFLPVGAAVLSHGETARSGF